MDNFNFYKDDRARSATFRGWRKESVISAVDLVECGFYYTGHDDQTRCYCCGCQVYGWQEDTDIWSFHVRLSPLCPHVIEKKGIEFIQKHMSNEIQHYSKAVNADAYPYTTSKSFTDFQDKKTAFENCDMHQRRGGVSNKENNVADSKCYGQSSNKRKREEEATHLREIRSHRSFRGLSNSRNQQKKYKAKCTHCYQHFKEIELLPCRHSFCRRCSLKMRNCFICRRAKKDINFL